MKNDKKKVEVLKLIRTLILNPFNKDLPLFLVLWILISAADFVFWILYGNPIFGFYMASHGLLMAYIVTFISGFLSGCIGKVFRWLILILGVVNVSIDTAVHLIMKCGFTKDLVAVFMGTNANETREFLSMYVNLKMILIIFTILAFAVVVYHLSKKYFNKLRYIELIGLILIVVCASVIFVRKSENWEGLYLMKIKTFLEYERTPNLRNYSKEYKIKKIDDLPENFVFIIGESLNKDHMSLYGYKKKTTPYLDSLRNKSDIIVFNNVKSSAIGTVPAFRYMMSSLRVGDRVEDWLKKDFLLDIIKSAGYNTMWISNQSSSGVHDNIVARFAELSDSVYWCGTKYMGPSKVDLDEVVFEPLKLRSNEFGNKPRFTIVHLAGNHESFRSRYSLNYEKFNEDDYFDYPENQRLVLSQYDNSIIYNDYIVSSIIRMFANKESIVIYMPDHSLDIYNSSSDYAGHARAIDEKSVEAGQNIPFIIYLSPLYKQKFSYKLSSIVTSVDRKYYTENIMYSVLDLMNISLDNDDIINYSLFRDK